MGRCLKEGGARALLLFDNECRLCRRAVELVAARDPEGRIAFAPLQSDLAGALLMPHGISGLWRHSVVLLDGHEAYTLSSAALRVARLMRPPWPALGLFLLVPALLRDSVYGFVARHRHRIALACEEPLPQSVQDRIVSMDCHESSRCKACSMHSR